MDDNKMYVTQDGYEALKKELDTLVNVKRAEIANRIKDAKEFGDISENAEYDMALQEQSFIEGRIAELEEILKVAVVADKANGDVIAVGSKVTVHIDGDEEMFHIVGAPEADPTQRKISHESPLGLALMGKKPGDKFEVEAPVGTLAYTVLKVE